MISIPALNWIRNQFKNSEIFCLTNSPIMERARGIEDVLRGSDLIDAFIAMPPGGGGIAKLAALKSQIRQLKFDLLIYLSEPPSKFAMLRDYIFYKTCGIHDFWSFPFRSDQTTYRTKNSEIWESETERLLRIVSGTSELKPDWSFSFKAIEQEQARPHIDALTASATGYIAFSLGAKLPDKDWGDRNWQRVLSIITEKHPELGLMAIGSGDEFERTERLISGWGGPRANLCGKTEPRISALAMKGARFYLGHDSGPMHLAALVGVPCTAVFSARAKPGVWYPRGEQNHIFYPMSYANSVSAKAGFRTAGQSIQEISAGRVAETCLQMLAPNGEQNS
ncbi:MAG: glycosyltransferase family 9 protein [Rhodospirillales bacterium]|nr:glycosyltransferase family 9 protein [Rhodospirillales bacterium]